MGESDEFRWLFVAEYPAVVRTAFLILHDYARAEEIAQDAFVQLLRHWSRVSRYESPDAWVRRVAIRLAVRDAKREARRSLLIRRDARGPTAPASDAVDIDLLAAIRTLPVQQRSVVVLFYFEDRPMDEIAGIVGCSISTGWVHLHRARKRLAALLAEEVDNDVR
jgi:RNA polymerase sigma factor (sigma-70 family)